MNKCEICGMNYKPIIPSQKYCSNWCRDIGKIPKSKRPKVYIRYCLNCGKKIKTTHSKKIFCSKECGSKHRINEKAKQYKKSYLKTNGYMKYVDEYIPTNTGYDRVLKKGKFKSIKLSENIIDRLDTLYYKHVGNDFNFNYLKRIKDSHLSHYEIMFYAKFKNIILYERIDND